MILLILCLSHRLKTRFLHFNSSICSTVLHFFISFFANFISSLNYKNKIIFTIKTLPHDNMVSKQTRVIKVAFIDRFYSDHEDYHNKETGGHVGGCIDRV